MQNRLGLPADSDQKKSLAGDLSPKGGVLTRLGRNRWYVANVFYSPLGQREVARYKTSRETLAEQLNDNVLHAAQRALDEIVTLATGAQSEAVRLKAAECIVDKALGDGKTARGSTVHFSVSEEALRLAVDTLREIEDAT